MWRGVQASAASVHTYMCVCVRETERDERRARTHARTHMHTHTHTARDFLFFSRASSACVLCFTSKHDQ